MRVNNQLEHIEDSTLKQLLDTSCIRYYTRYVDDVLLIYDHTRTTYDSILTYINSIHNNLQLIPSPETDNQVNFLDLLISRKPENLEIDIFCKPTTTNTTINFLSNHPMEHKMAAYRFHLERMYSLPLNQTHLQNEWETIKQIADSNNFPITILHKLKEHSNTSHSRQPQKRKRTQNGQLSHTTPPTLEKSHTCSKTQT